jgi:transcription antitermination factor NusG
MSDTNTKRAKIVRNFKDAGTETQFTAGETVNVSEGAFANYHAAGLVEEADAEAAPVPAEGDPAKVGRTRS